jgi:uncharacterized protein (DUF849 family)
MPKSKTSISGFTFPSRSAWASLARNWRKSLISPGSTWSAFGLSKGHIPILYATIALGGHVRVGLEDNVYYSKDVVGSNVQMVERAARLIKEANRQPATPDEERQILGLKGSKNTNF